MAISQNQINSYLNDKENGATNLTAAIHRDEWKDWKTRFKPYLEKLAGKVTSGETVSQAVSRADQSVGLGFANARRNLQQDQQGLGISLTPGQKEAQDRKLGLAEAAAKVDARNDARVSAKDRENALMAGGAGQGLSMARS